MGKPNRGVNGPLRRNEGGMRDNSNGMNQERKCFRCRKTGHVNAQCRWAQGTCIWRGNVGIRKWQVAEGVGL